MSAARSTRSCASSAPAASSRPRTRRRSPPRCGALLEPDALPHAFEGAEAARRALTWDAAAAAHEARLPRGAPVRRRQGRARPRASPRSGSCCSRRSSRASRSGSCSSRAARCIFRQQRAGKDGDAVLDAEVPHDGPERGRARPRAEAQRRPVRPRSRTTRASRAAAASCGARASTSCRSSGTCCAAR